MINRKFEMSAQRDDVGGEAGVSCSDGRLCFNFDAATIFNRLHTRRFCSLNTHERANTVVPLLECRGLSRRGSELLCSLVCRGANPIYPSQSDELRTASIALVPAKDVLAAFRPTRESRPLHDSPYPDAE